ncbi:MAG TPA: secondary thiamine-phosphate synthase enzyme YjbQ [Candidatus Eisenbacteria bacterium]
MAPAEFEYPVPTGRRIELVNVTRQVAQAAKQSGVETGIALVSVPHTTCALIVNEDEPGLREDILRLVTQVVEPLRAAEPFAHDRIDDNAAAHLGSVLLQCSVAVPITSGRPALGTWQSVFLVELDGPRRRTLRVTIR